MGKIGDVIENSILNVSNAMYGTEEEEDIGFYDVANSIISIRNTDDTRKRVNLGSGQIVNNSSEGTSQPKTEPKKEEPKKEEKKDEAKATKGQ